MEAPEGGGGALVVVVVSAESVLPILFNSDIVTTFTSTVLLYEIIRHNTIRHGNLGDPICK